MKQKKELYIGFALLAAFSLWTLAVCLVNVELIGPNGSQVGFATLNRAVHEWTGVNWTLYEITDWLGLIPLATVAGFAVTGLVQWIRRKHIFRVDRTILALGVFYAAVAVSFVLFEVFPVNYRPVLIEGVLEASYPSSTTLLAITVLPTAIIALCRYMPNSILRWSVCVFFALLTAVLLIGRFVSGVHWTSDIIGGVLLGAGLILLWDATSREPKPIDEKN